MAVGLLGTKLGMTQMFDGEGNLHAVTVIQAGPCPVTQVKNHASDAYNAIQVGYGEVKEKALSKPELGHLKKAKASALRHLKEFRVEGEPTHQVGDVLTVSVFEAGQKVDVIGTSIGKGTMGIVRRYHAGRGPMAHGSKFHRHNGSIGAGTTPSRVYKGVKMPGRMGNEQVTVRHLEVLKVDPDKNLLLIKGAVPGAENGLLVIQPAKRVGKVRS